MSKFLAIFIAAALIFSLFLTVFAMGDEISSEGDKTTTSAQTSSVSGTAQPSVVVTDPSHGVEADIFIDTTGHHGYSIVDGVAFFFVKLDYADFSGIPASVYFQGRDLVDLGYVCNVRVSDDGSVWTMPGYVDNPAQGYSYTYSLMYPSIYVSYTMLEVESEAEAQEHYQKIFNSAFSDESVFKAYLSDHVGDLPGSSAN